MKQVLYIEQYIAQSIITTMSIDVFGRQLGRSSSKRGPPGNGYKMTTEGHYDVENKRLCNIASPEDLNDAVNVYYLRLEMKNVYDNVSKLKTEVSNLDKKEEGVVVNRILNHIDTIDAQIHAIHARIDMFISKFEARIENFDAQALLSLKLVNHSIKGLRDDYIKLREEQNSQGATQTGSS